MSNGSTKAKAPGVAGGLIAGLKSALGANTPRKDPSKEYGSRPEGRPERPGIADPQELGGVGMFDDLAAFQQRQRRLRADEGREMDRLVRMLEGAPGELRDAQGVATNEMRRQAALRMASQGGRGNVIGAMSAAKGVGQEAENIGTRFGDRIRDAARTAAQARIERQQQRIEGAVKPGQDYERVRGALDDLIATYGRDSGRYNPQGFKEDFMVLKNTTDDPVALALLRRVQRNLEQGLGALEGIE